MCQALDGFMFMVNGDRHVEFVSDNVVNYLHFTPVCHCSILHRRQMTVRKVIYM